MNYHNILYDDMRNGDGLRVVLFVSGCEHYCVGCHNSQTWDVNSGVEFDESAKKELFEELDKPYISGITFSGGDPLHPDNLNTVVHLCNEIRNKYARSKTIWLYTGYKFEDIFINNETVCDKSLKRQEIIRYVDILVDGEFIKEKLNINYPWAGSTNQRVIDVKKSLKENKIILWDK